MDFLENVSLADYSTMRLGGAARFLCDVSTTDELIEALNWAEQHQIASLMIGGGSNIIWDDAGFDGLIIVNKIMGYEASEQTNGSVNLRIGAGEPWDPVVARSVEAGLSGIEALSLIPGTSGGTPIQNVGAYGQDIAQTLVSVEAFDKQTGELITISNADCSFSYRDSRFKSADRGRFYITHLTLCLTRGRPQPPYYSSVQAYFDEHGIHDPSAADLRAAVMAIRSAKLPDPAVVANTGSFFGNPIIDEKQFLNLRDQYPDLIYWATGEQRYKLSAAWLIEQSGFKDFHDLETGMATWPRQPLVLVNEKARSTADLLAFKHKIVDAVRGKFQVVLKQEPEML